MSMLIGASNITLKDQVQFFDDGVTKKFIKSMYFWNMEFNGKESIKGDFNIVARGTKSLIAKEVKMEQINQFLALTNNDIDNQYIKRDVLLRELAEVFDLDRLGFIRSEAEVAVNQKQDAERAKQDSDRALILEAMKAESSGHVPNAVAKTAQLFNIQLPGGATPEQAGETLQERPIG
jgi:sulfur transfer complex TusBCD TusB component (DsrH family)